MASEIKVDTISEKTSAGGVTIDGLLIKDGNISGDVALAGTTPTFTIGDAGAEDATLLFDGNAQDFHIGLDDTADDLVIGVGSTLGTTTAIAIDENANTTFSGTVTVGVDNTGKDVKLFGATSGSYWLWDESADGVVQIGTLTVGVDNTGHDVKLFGATSGSYWLWDESADGVVQIGTLTVGVDNTGHDVKLFGATSGSYALWDESADDLNLIASGLGITTAKDLGAGIHIRTADSGASVHSSGDELVIEGSGTVGMTFLSGNDQNCNIFFGDDGDNNIGYIEYDHSANAMTLGDTASNSLRLDGQKLSTGGEAAADCDAGGITLDQNASDGKLISFKSSDIAHGITSQVETDTWGQISKYDGAPGGMDIWGFSETGMAMQFKAFTGEDTANSTKSTSGEAAVRVNVFQHNGSAGVELLPANSNLFTVENAGGTKFIVDVEGELHSDGGAQTAYDEYDDAQLIRACDLSRGRGTIDSKFDKFIAYNHEHLADLKLVGREEDGTPNHFINVTGMQRLHNGAIWQQYEKHNQLLEAVYDLAKEAVGEEKANAILDKHEVKRLQ